MSRYIATRTLLASRADVWTFLADPHRLADWWPGIVGVTPDRRGFATGARWAVHGSKHPSLTRKAYHAGTLDLRRVRPQEYAAWHLAPEGLDVEIDLEEAESARTRVTLSVAAPWHSGLRRKMPQKALGRLYDLCQTSWPEDLEV
jgi:uncharacterized protein YndB with AHSA1/START domain